MVDLLIFFGKIFLSPLVFILVYMIVMVPFSIVNVSLYKFGTIPIIVTTTIMFFVTLFIYSFYAAYVYEVYLTYTAIFNIKWIFYIFCLVSIVFLNAHFQNEYIRSSHLLQETNPLGKWSVLSKKKFSLEDLKNINSIVVSRTSWIMIISFLLFSFFPIYHKIYGDLPKILSQLFSQ